MLDNPVDKPVVRRKTSFRIEPAAPALKWWDGCKHPMTDAQFVQAFCEHVLLHTDDHSLRDVRDRAFRFIRNFMSPTLEEELTVYRETYR